MRERPVSDEVLRFRRDGELQHMRCHHWILHGLRAWLLRDIFRNCECELCDVHRGQLVRGWHCSTCAVHLFRGLLLGCWCRYDVRGDGRVVCVLLVR